MNTMTKKQAYNVLGLSHEVSNDVVREAFQHGTDYYHPSSPTADAEKLQEIIAAYKCIVGDTHNGYRIFHSTHEKKAEIYSDFDNGRKDRQNFGYATKRHNLKEKLFVIYTLIKKRKWRKLIKQKNLHNIACFCSYGLMIRQALEVYLSEVAEDLGIRLEEKPDKEKTVDKLIAEILSNKRISKELRQTIYDAKDIGNDAAHLLSWDKDELLFDKCYNFYNHNLELIIEDDYLDKCYSFYNEKFKLVLEDHLKTKPFPKKRYLHYLYNELNNFNIRKLLPSTILKANLMRQIVESIVDLWCYNEKLPIAFNTIDEKGESIDTFEKLSALKTFIYNPQKHFEKISYDNLHLLRNQTNNIVHAPQQIHEIKDFNKKSKSLDIALSREVVEVLKPSSSVSYTRGKELFNKQKNPTSVAVLCFFLGNLGIHNFYVGKIGLGFLYLFTNGLFGIGIIVDLFTMFTGTFKDANGKKMKKTKAPLVCLLISVLALIAFAILQSYLNFDVEAWIKTIIP